MPQICFQLTATPSMRDGAAGRVLATLQAKEAMIASETNNICYICHNTCRYLPQYLLICQMQANEAIIASEEVTIFVFVLAMRAWA